MALVDRLKEELNYSYSLDSNLQHLLHMFAGYRSVIIKGEESRPYHPGGAKDISFQIGRKLAEEDLKKENELE